MDWTRLCHSAVRCSDQERAAFEARVAADPNDVEARVLLVGALWLPVDEHRQRARGEHLVWLATHRPDIGLGSYGTLIEEYAPQERAALRDAWKSAAADPKVDLVVLDNAARCLGSDRPADSEALYRRAVARDPGNYEWREWLAWSLVRQERPLEAITELEAALERTDVDRIVLGLCLRLLEAVVMSKQWDWVAELAPRILADNEALGPSWQYGNAIHHAYIALGWAAHARGELAEASFYLLESAKMPGSPQLNSFGPDRKLAEAIYAAGDRVAVRAYFEACRAFWVSGAKHLDAAIAAIDRGDAALP